jgi:hypothetical protein
MAGELRGNAGAARSLATIAFFTPATAGRFRLCVEHGPAGRSGDWHIATTFSLREHVLEARFDDCTCQTFVPATRALLPGLN